MIALGRHEIVALALEPRPWSYATLRNAEIEAHWRLARALCPGYFNGIVHMLSSSRASGPAFRGELLLTDFKSFLHWRALGQPDRSVRCVGVGAVLWSSDGAVLLGTAARGMANAGRTYIFSGVLDDRDVETARGADVVAGGLRELVEETGLAMEEIAPASPWIWSIEDGVWVNFACESQVRMPAEAARDRILAHNASLPEPELSDVVIIRSPADLDRPDIFDTTRTLVRRVMESSAMVETSR